MSKAEGKQIVVKFTMPLLGDVTGNVSAFSVTGQEYQYINGPIINKNYGVVSVERYPTLKEWESLNPLTLQSSETPSGYGGDLTSLGVPISSNFFGAGYEKEKAFDKNTSTLWYATGTTGQWIGIDFQSSPQKIMKFTMLMTAPRFKGYVFEASNDNSNWTPLSTGDFANIASVQTITFSNSQSFRYYRLRCTSVYTGSNVGVNELEMIAGVFAYETERVETFPPIQIDGSYRIAWSEDKPTGTDITIEYSTGATQGSWMQLGNGDLITPDTNLWLRATLETTDTTKTPTLSRVWIEEPIQPQDKLLITVDQFSRFNNVEGQLTVSYNQALGDLKGITGDVLSFNYSFTPTDLRREINPNDEETIRGVIIATLDYSLISYLNASSTDQHTIKANVLSATVEYTDVTIVNP